MGEGGGRAKIAVLSLRPRRRAGKSARRKVSEYRRLCSVYNVIASFSKR